ncbi:MAG TPA: NADH:flavin oxidoreductase/NADH oxidase [Humisphaera sp.]|jgi:2,4-dienoyl-CoA reductase-like NADH-dependent reductase (Old Yellow Enzyme family)|nr:NADH:flavin oxidoreductase/NADH oxidase [Humisphaera sp.]
MSPLFTPAKFRDITLRNRICVSPMCQYSSDDGLPTDWHLVHLGSRAIGGAALVMVEATAVSPEGRISPWDSGIWSDGHARAFVRITRFIKEHGACAAIQLAHAGRKASTDRPWLGGKPLGPERGGWQPIGPSALPFDKPCQTPRQMSVADINAVTVQFVDAARRALDAGFDVIELHMAHGYLLHEFLSPLSNQRTDDFGGSVENRMRFPLRVAKEVREIWPQRLPLFARVSATDWAEGGWDLPQSIHLAQSLKEVGVDLIDCSSGGLTPQQKIQLGPGYQVPFAEAIRREAGIATGAVGLITQAKQAEQIIASGQADLVLLAREMLRDPYWPLHAAQELGAELEWPAQYGRAKVR